MKIIKDFESTPTFLKIITLITIIFNMLDAFLTGIFIQYSNHLQEWNPLMAIVLNDLNLFILIKFILIPFFLFFLLIQSSVKTIAKIGLYVAYIVYGLLMLIWFHIAF